MKIPLILVSLLVPTFALAEAPVEIDYPARLQSVENLKQHIAQREARLESLKQELRTLDARVETQIEGIVKNLASLKDSKDSKTRVANIKGDVIQALVRSIAIYRQKRMEVFERLRKDASAPQEQLERELAIFDERVGKRIGQVMEIARSFPGHKDVQKYESEGSSYWNGWSQENTRISDEWKQNRRNSNSGEKVRRELIQALDKALQTNQSRRDTLADNLANRKLSDEQRATQQNELGRLDATLDHLRMQKRELALPAAGATREIGLDEAHDAEQMLDDARDDISRDMFDVLRKFADIDREGVKIHALKENLKAREEWLKKNPPPADK
jgi:chromosome segregation ATPase